MRLLLVEKAKFEERKRRWLRSWQKEFRLGKAKGVKRYYVYDLNRDFFLLSEDQPMSEELSSTFHVKPTLIEVLSYHKIHQAWAAPSVMQIQTWSI